MALEQGELRTAAARRVYALAGLLSIAALGLWARSAWLERFVSDDAYISFRYADHLARGLGLVWNAGERVEGYTNFLWTVLLAGGMRLGLAPELLSQVLGAASALALLGAAFLSGGAGPAGRVRGALVALALGAHGSFGAWSTSGLETMLFTLLVWLATWRFLGEREDERARPLSALLFAIATLTRPEGALFAGLAGLFLLADVVRGCARASRLVAWGFVLATIVGAHLGWRVAYYGDWLPNTFRAKVPGTRFDQGFAHLLLYEQHFHAAVFVPLAACALLGARRRAALLLAQLGAYLAYFLAVGGDRFEFRFLVPVLPHFAWLVVEGAWALAFELRTASAPRARPLLALAALGAFLMLTVRGFTPRDVDRHDVAQVAGIRAYADRRAHEGRTLRAWIERGVLPRDLVLCVGGAGAVPYYTGWTTVDRRGLNDRWIASQALAKRTFVAHERDAPYEYLARRRVAVFDCSNKLLFSDAAYEKLPGAKSHDGRWLALRSARLGDERLVFATFLPDTELAALLPALEIEAAPTPPWPPPLPR